MQRSEKSIPHDGNHGNKNLKGSEELEESMLQTMGRKIDILVDRKPKCHCELAGEGIEYSWGCSKNKYRLLPLSEKRKKENCF